MPPVPSRDSLLRASTFRRQLSVMVAVGVLILALASSLAISWQSSSDIRQNRQQQGQQLADSLARQARLALLVDSSDNVADAVAGVLAFPDVMQVEIRRTDGRALSVHAAGGTSVALTDERPPLDRLGANAAVLESEDASAWHFVAAVRTADHVSPFEAQETQGQTLGYVRVVLSKASLQRTLYGLFALNMAISVAFALVFLLVTRWLTLRMTRPLQQLARAMGRAEEGESGVRAELTGPRDIANMAHAFNSMMSVLDEREQALRLAREEALQLARLKAEFAATMSHELRTPLNGVVGTLDMLRASTLPPSARNYVNLAWESSQYLLDLINNILDFSSLDAGKLVLTESDFDIARICAQTVDLVSTQLGSKALRLSYTVGSEVPAVLRGDPRRLHQILLNLVGNAVKFTERGTVRVAVTAEGAFGEHGRIRCAVSDTGVGVPAAARASIFDSFTQADPSSTRSHGGSGLGLAICKQLCTLMGGEIGVDSEPGQGSTFWFTLPLHRGRGVAGALPMPPMHAPEPAPMVAQPASARARLPRLLVVEDNRTSQTIVSGMLDMLGCAVKVVDNGRAAVQAFKREPWDLILMDCNMPEMDGFEATAMIRVLEGEGGVRVPIVAMTANTQPADVAKCLSAGMDDHLSKPLMLDSLSAHLQRWLPGLTLLPPAPPAEETPADRSDEPVDPAALERLHEALGGAIGQAIAPFLEDMPAYMETMEASAEAGDSQTLRRAAHAVKGAAGTFGAAALVTLAKSMEAMAEAGHNDNAAALMPRLRAEYALVSQALHQVLTGAPEVPLPASSVGAARVLVVDDDRSTRSALRATLQRSGFVVTEACNGGQVAGEVERMRPDVILMDALMPVMDGFAACAQLQASAQTRDIPVLMITALEDRASIERAFSVGASDYIPKPLHLAVVNQRVRRLVDATRAQREVRHLAYNDSLTGLPNRALFNDHLNHCIEQAGHQGHALALLYLDLDRFKFVNDTLGHEVGDKLLKMAAERIRACVRASDCVARLGGDEFAIVIDELPNASIASATAQKICHAVMAPFDIGGHDIMVSASIGIAIFPSDGVDASALLRRADTAMYRAKKKSSDFQFFEEAMEVSAADHLRFEGALRHALERNEFAVYFQPIADAAHGAIVGMEALVRWKHPTRGLVSPLEFIPLAEETGLIVPIGDWVLRAACHQLKTWQDAGWTDLYVTVNLSGLQLQQPHFAETLRDALRETGLPPQCLVLEITESMLMEQVEETLLVLQALKATGVGLAIDDFGTGYSSLAYLKRFPVDVLKIDRAFIRDMTDNTDDALIVKGIIALAHSLRLKVVAEGVETAEQHNFLARLQCNLIQGYLLSEPLPAAAFAARFHEQGERLPGASQI